MFVVSELLLDVLQLGACGFFEGGSVVGGKVYENTMIPAMSFTFQNGSIFTKLPGFPPVFDRSPRDAVDRTGLPAGSPELAAGGDCFSDSATDCEDRCDLTDEDRCVFATSEDRSFGSRVLEDRDC